MTQKWQRREISNFEYLMFLNTIAGKYVHWAQRESRSRSTGSRSAARVSIEKEECVCSGDVGPFLWQRTDGWNLSQRIRDVLNQPCVPLATPCE